MPKYIRTVICLVLLATAIGPVAAQDDAICEALRVIHATQGDSLTAYLSEKGEDCLEAAATTKPTATPSEPVWTAEGRGPTERSVSVELERGVYSLNAPVWIADADAYAQLREIVGVPKSCFFWETVALPSTIRVERDCTIHATLEVDTGHYKSGNWEFSIMRQSEKLPPVPGAHGWSAQGIGYAVYPIEVVFEIGVYRVDKHRGPDSAILVIKSSTPNRCLGTAFRAFSLPTQRSIERRCHIKGYLEIGDVSVARGWYATSWSYSITRLD